MLTVSYFSAGVSSAVATKLMIEEIDRVMYTHIDDQHPDTMRFVKDCEAWFGKPVEVLRKFYEAWVAWRDTDKDDGAFLQRLIDLTKLAAEIEKGEG